MNKKNYGRSRYNECANMERNIASAIEQVNTINSEATTSKSQLNDDKKLLKKYQDGINDNVVGLVNKVKNKYENIKDNTYNVFLKNPKNAINTMQEGYVQLNSASQSNELNNLNTKLENLIKKDDKIIKWCKSKKTKLEEAKKNAENQKQKFKKWVS